MHIAPTVNIQICPERNPSRQKKKILVDLIPLPFEVVTKNASATRSSTTIPNKQRWIDDA
jgi:phenylpyruvate tautomerase PptA (4-oxalocrotonate tautomerase family)